MRICRSTWRSEPASGLEKTDSPTYLLGMSIEATLSLVPRRNHPIAEA